jgi:hypothetical protein
MSNIVLKTKHMFGYIIKVLKAKNKVFFFFSSFVEAIWS